jgi:hypothetical protein
VRLATQDSFGWNRESGDDPGRLTRTAAGGERGRAQLLVTVGEQLPEFLEEIQSVIGDLVGERDERGRFVVGNARRRQRWAGVGGLGGFCQPLRGHPGARNAVPNVTSGLNNS